MRLMLPVALAAASTLFLAAPPARGQEFAYGYTYLWADGDGVDLEGYSTTTNNYGVYWVSVAVYARIYDPSGEPLGDPQEDDEDGSGMDAYVSLFAEADGPGWYEAIGNHWFYGYYDGDADPPETYAPAFVNQTPSVSDVDIDGVDYQNAPSGLDFAAGSDNTITFDGVDLAGVTPTITYCDGDWSITGWTNTGSSISTTLTVWQSLASGCTIEIALLQFPQIVIALSPPPALTVTIHNGSATGPDISGSTRTVTVGAYPDIFAVPSGGVPTYQWSLPPGADALSTAWNDQVQSTAGEPAAVTALTGSELTWAFWDTKDAGQQVAVSATAGGVPATAGVTYNISPPAVTSLSATETAPNITTGCPTQQGANAMGLCPGQNAPGITFSYNQAADGSYELVQVVNSSTITYTPSSGQPCVLINSGVDTLPPAHDNDSPSVALDNAWVEISASESFSTYLMFQPRYGSWVPVSVVNWSWAGDAVNNSGTWTLKPSSSPGSTTSLGGSSAGFPSWSQVNTPGQCPPQ